MRQEAMRTRIFFAQLALFIFLIAVAGGCQQEPGALTPVTGRVLYKGVPVRGGIIVFTPDAGKGERGAIAHSAIQEDGSFSLVTGDAAGAHPGWYQVAISSPGPDAPLQGQNFGAPESTVPVEYGHPEKSKINCKVNADQPNSFVFDLK
jgi:hypothetical protein